tara:strand:+ start:453 stop:896 length:444 start_codon:yes stop_codon:yes gene_type:complete
MNIRAAYRKGSNNENNTNQNVCTQAVAKWAGVENSVRYLHTNADLKRALRSRFSVRSIKSALGKAQTVGAARKVIAKLFADRDDLAAIYISVPGHAMLVGRDGQTIIDTDPRTRDRRRIVHANGLYTKAASKAPVANWDQIDAMFVA